MYIRSKIILIVSLFLIVSLSTVSCKKKDANVDVQKRLIVVTSLFPVYDFAKNIGKEKAQVNLLLPPGIEPHSFEPKPGDIVEINNADIFIYTGRFMEPWVENILKGIDNKNLIVVDSSKGITPLKKSKNEEVNKEDIDPHIWLDLANAKKMADNILEGFIKRDVLNKDFFSKNAASYKAELNDMDARFKESFSNCKKNVFIHGGHFAFDYLATRYDLKYISAYKGFSPDSEPTPRHLTELIKKMKRYNIRQIYYEELITPRMAEIIGKETGATLLKLHGAHNVTKDEIAGGITFLSIMEKNLQNLKIGLQCP